MTFVREADGDRIVAIFNLSPHTIFSDFHTGIYAGEYKNEITGLPETLHEHTWGDIAPWSYKILSKNL